MICSPGIAPPGSDNTKTGTQPMTDADLNTLILELQRTTALGRINHSEAHTVFARLTELGYGMTAPASPISGRPDTP
jgi:hypothetical protein